jgi:hypothetical protein
MDDCGGVRSGGSPRPPRWRRWAGLDRSPLCRPCDRFEARAGALLLLAFVALAPLAGWLAGGATYRASAQTEHLEGSARTSVPAVLLADANPPPVGFAVLPSVAVLARWTAPDGTPRTGAIVVTMSAPAGTAVPVWTDRAGNLVDPPRGHDQTAMRASVAAIVVVFGLAALLVAARAAVRHAVNRRRMASWDAAWSRVAPWWTDPA